MSHRNSGRLPLIAGVVLALGSTVACSDDGATSVGEDSGTTSDLSDAGSDVQTRPTSPNGDGGVDASNTMLLDASASNTGDNSDSPNDAEAQRSSGATAVATDQTGLNASTRTNAPSTPDASATTFDQTGTDSVEPESSASSEPVTSTNSTATTSTSGLLETATTESDDEGPDGGSPDPVVELPPRPQVTIPAIPTFEFDETSCQSPRMGEQTVELQADIIDLQGIDCIIGDLNIWPTSLLDVSGLESLRYVSGEVLVGVSQSLNSLVGLGTLETIGGNLTIQQTPVLVSATGLSGLKRVGGNVRILQNVTLQTLNGLDALEAIGGNFELTDNQNLNLLGNGLSALEYVGGLFTIKDNPVLLGLELDAFEHAAGGLYVSDNAALFEVTLPALKYSGADIIIANGATTELDLSGLEATAGDLHVLPNDEGVSFSDLTAVNFDALQLVGGEVLVSTGPDLLALSWPTLTFVDGAFTIGTAEAVLDLDLPELARVGGAFRLQALERLRNIELPNLVEVGGLLALTDNARLEAAHFPQLVTVTGLVGAFQAPILETLELPQLVTAGGFSISECGQELQSLGTVDLRSLRELEGEFYVAASSGEPTFIAPELTTVGSFAFEDNDFVTLEGFPKLESVGADLVVQRHAQLGRVVGFDNLTAVGGDVWILDNAQLNDLSGFERLSSVAGIITYEELPELSELVLDVTKVTELHVRDCGMGTVALPELVSAYTILFNDNSSMSCLHLPKLTTMEPVSFGNPPLFGVNSSPFLPECQVDAIRAQIDADDLIYTNSFNNDSATCAGERCW